MKRSAARHYGRNLQTRAGVEEALAEREMFLAGVSVRRVVDITGALWGDRVNQNAITGLNQRIPERAQGCRRVPADGAIRGAVHSPDRVDRTARYSERGWGRGRLIMGGK